MKITTSKHTQTPKIARKFKHCNDTKNGNGENECDCSNMYNCVE